MGKSSDIIILTLARIPAAAMEAGGDLWQQGAQREAIVMDALLGQIVDFTF